jgi:hypothetical protein
MSSKDSTQKESSSGISEKINSVLDAAKTADSVIGSIRQDPSEDNVRKVLGQFVANRDLTKRELCPHGCSFLCRICDG